MTRIAVLVSGGGTNLQALLDAQDSGLLSHGRISLVLSSRDGAYALERAKRHSISTNVVCRKNYPSSEAFDHAILEILEQNNIQLIVLAGFLSILGPKLVARYNHRILNIHPSLIPAFCGPGFYGLKVHQAALDYGVKVTGATVHYVNEIVDGGQIILQKAVEILPEDTAETLQKRVMEQAEWLLLPQAVELVCQKLGERDTC